MWVLFQCTPPFQGMCLTLRVVLGLLFGATVATCLMCHSAGLWPSAGQVPACGQVHTLATPALQGQWPCAQMHDSLLLLPCYLSTPSVSGRIISTLQPLRLTPCVLAMSTCGRCHASLVYVSCIHHCNISCHISYESPGIYVSTNTAYHSNNSFSLCTVPRDLCGRVSRWLGAAQQPGLAYSLSH
jgi:hypothetical protein